MKKEKVFVLSWCCLCILSGLTGCERFSGRQDTVHDGVSSDIVSSVTAVEGTGQTERIPLNYYERNSTNLYLSSGDYNTVIVQRKLDGTLVKTLEPELRRADMISVRYVDDKWLYYTRWRKKDDSAELWRAPIQKRDDCDDVKLEQEELVLVSDDGIYDSIYVAGDVLYYSEASEREHVGAYRKYDLKRQRQVKFRNGAPKQSLYSANYWLGFCNETMFLARDDELANDDHSGGIYAQEQETDIFHRITKHFVNCCVFNEKYMYFTEYTGEEDRDCVKIYGEGIREPEVYVSHKQVRAAMEEQGFAKKEEEVTIEFLYLTEERLYILAEADMQSQVVLSCGLTGEPVLTREQKLYDRYKDKFINGEFGTEGDIYFVDGKCLVEDYSDEESTYECCDLTTGETKTVTEQDEEYWWQYWY